MQDIGLFAVTESQCTEDEHDDDSKFRNLSYKEARGIGAFEFDTAIFSITTFERQPEQVVCVNNGMMNLSKSKLADIKQLHRKQHAAPDHSLAAGIMEQRLAKMHRLIESDMGRQSRHFRRSPLR